MEFRNVPICKTCNTEVEPIKDSGRVCIYCGGKVLTVKDATCNECKIKECMYDSSFECNQGSFKCSECGNKLDEEETKISSYKCITCNKLVRYTEVLTVKVKENEDKFGA